MSHRCETAVRTFPFSSATSPTSTLGAWENKSSVFPKKRWMRSPTIPGQVISGNCRTVWIELSGYLPVHRCECRWLKFLLTQTLAPLAVATRWSRPSESRLCEHSKNAIGLSEAFMERQRAWASRGRRSHTRCRRWGSLAHCSDGHLANARNLPISLEGGEIVCIPIYPQVL